MRQTPIWLKGLMILAGLVSLIIGSFCSMDLPLLFCLFPGLLFYGIWHWRGE